MPMAGRSSKVLPPQCSVTTTKHKQISIRTPCYVKTVIKLRNGRHMVGLTGLKSEYDQEMPLSNNADQPTAS